MDEVVDGEPGTVVVELPPADDVVVVVNEPGTVDVKFTWKARPAATSVLSASLRLSPTTLGMVTGWPATPSETFKVMDMPFVTFLPGAGSVETTVPAGLFEETKFVWPTRSPSTFTWFTASVTLMPTKSGMLLGVVCLFARE